MICCRIRKAGLFTSRPPSPCHFVRKDTAVRSSQPPALVESLQTQLLLSSTTSDTLAAALLESPEYDSQVAAENISLLSGLFPRSSMRRVEQLLVKNPQVLGSGELNGVCLPGWPEHTAQSIAARTVCSTTLTTT